MKKKKNQKWQPPQQQSDIPKERSGAAYKGVHNTLIWASALFVAGMTFIVYLPALQNGFVYWDDDVYVYNNPNIQSLGFNFLKWSFSAIVAVLWHPLTMISLALDYSMWGLNPFGYHLTNNLFHSLNTAVVFILVIQLIECRGVGKGNEFALTSAFVTSLLFGIHPLHVESVAWVSERKDVLCAFFFLLTIFFYIRYASTAIKMRALIYYALCLSVYILALMSKPMAVTLPMVLLILDLYPLERFSSQEKVKNKSKVMLEKVPFFIASLAVSLIAVYAHQSGGALRTIEEAPLLSRLAVAMHSFLFYLVKMGIPYQLAPFYPYPKYNEIFTLAYIGSGILFAVITFFCLQMFKRNRVFIATWFYYIVTLLPVVGVIQVGGHAAADRYTYLPSLGPFLLAGMGIGAILGVLSTWRNKIVGMIVLIALASFFAERTFKQIAIWHDSITLWTHELTLYPNVPVAYNNRGNAHNDTGNRQAAIDDYTKAIEVGPRYAEAYYNRGTVYLSLGNYQQAITDLTKAIDLNQYYIDAYSNRGVAFGHLGNPEQAMIDFTKVIELNPQDAEAFYSRGFAIASLGNYRRAVTDFTRAIELNLKDAKVYRDRGIAYGSLGNYQEAITDLTRAVELEPQNAKAFFVLGITYSRAGHREHALSCYTKAASLGLKEAQNYLDNLKR